MRPRLVLLAALFACQSACVASGRVGGKARAGADAEAGAQRGGARRERGPGEAPKKEGGAPEGVKELANQLKGPSELVVDGDTLYWVNTGEGAVVAMPKRGGARRTLAQGQSSPYRIAQDATSIYWATVGSNIKGKGEINRDGAIFKAPKAGGAPQPLVKGLEAVQTLAVEGGQIYFADLAGGELMRAPATGGPARPAAEGAPRGLVNDTVVFDGANVYWIVGTGTKSGVVLKAPKAGGKATALFESPGSRLRGLALSGATLFFSAAAGPKGAGVPEGGGLFALPTAGGPPKLLASGVAAQAVVAEGGHVYALDKKYHPYLGLSKIDAASGAVTPLVEKLGPSYQFQGSIALDAERVYWTTRPDPIATPTGVVASAPR